MSEGIPYHDPIQRYATQLNLKYEPEFDFYFCKNNPALCNALEQDKIIPTLEINDEAVRIMGRFRDVIGSLSGAPGGGGTGILGFFGRAFSILNPILNPKIETNSKP